MSDQTAQQGKGVQSVLASLEGQTLYELYQQGLVTRSWQPARPLARLPRQVGDMPMDHELVQWKALTSMQKAFWQELAMNFLKVTA